MSRIYRLYAFGMPRRLAVRAPTWASWSPQAFRFRRDSGGLLWATRTLTRTMSSRELVNLFVVIGTTRDGQGSARLPFVHALASGNVDIGVADHGHHTTVDEDIDSAD